MSCFLFYPSPFSSLYIPKIFTKEDAVLEWVCPVFPKIFWAFSPVWLEIYWKLPNYYLCLQVRPWSPFSWVGEWVFRGNPYCTSSCPPCAALDWVYLRSSCCFLSCEGRKAWSSKAAEYFCVWNGYSTGCSLLEFWVLRSWIGLQMS